jgi:Meckel syndrome type 1 protein
MTLAIAAPANPSVVGTAQTTSVSLAMIQTLRDPGGFAATLAVHQPGVPMPATDHAALATPLPVAPTPGKIMPPHGKPVPALALQDMPRPAPAARDKAAKPASTDTAVPNADPSFPPAPPQPAVAMPVLATPIRPAPAAQTAPAPDRPQPQNAGARMQPVAKTDLAKSDTAQSDGAQPAASAGASATTPAPVIQPDPTALAMPVAQATQTFVASMTVAGQAMVAQISPANHPAQGVQRHGRNAGQAPAAIITTPQLADGPATASVPRTARPANAAAPVPRPAGAEAQTRATDERPNPASDIAPGGPIAPPVAPAMASSAPLFTPAPDAAAPTDFATLVDSIARARAEQPSAPGATVGVTLTHADFGRVGLQFSPNNDGSSAALAVTLHSADPGFAPAVAAATASSAAITHATTHGANQPGQQSATGPAPDPLARNGGTDAQAGSGHRPHQDRPHQDRPHEDDNRHDGAVARATAAQGAAASGGGPDETGIFA